MKLKNTIIVHVTEISLDMLAKRLVILHAMLLERVKLYGFKIPNKCF